MKIEHLDAACPSGEIDKRADPQKVEHEKALQPARLVTGWGATQIVPCLALKAIQPGRVPVFAMLLAGAVCTTASLASAQRVDPPSPPAGETAQTPGTELIGPAESESKVEETASLEEAQPFRPPSFPKMALLDTAHVLTSPFRWRGREWALFSASTAAVAALTLADASVSDAARERGPTLGFVGVRESRLLTARRAPEGGI